MKTKVIGWDIGGAHVKAVFLDHQGDVISALQVFCPLWQGLDELEAAVCSVLKQFAVNSTETSHAVTMTGELVDIFPNRHIGVVEISNKLMALLGQHVYFYSSQSDHKSQRFIHHDEVLDNSVHIASANWHASARYIAKKIGTGLLIDIGSTTTDIIPIVNNMVMDVGLLDASRMQQDSLVYTGVARTPVMALAHKVVFDGIEVNVAAEHFSTMADVYRLTGELHKDNDVAVTADGKSKTKQDTARRLARMIGHDVEDKTMASWEQLAFSFRAIQIKQIKKAAMKHVQSKMPVVGAGVGAFLAKRLAGELNCTYISIEDGIGKDVAQSIPICLPAYAVAHFLFWQKAT